MKIMWFCNMKMPDVCEYLNIPYSNTGGWLHSLINEVKYLDYIEHIYVVTIYNGNCVKKFSKDNVTYILVPGNPMKKNKKIKDIFKKIINEYTPDIIDIQGIEFYTSYEFFSVIPESIPTVITIQGLTSEIYKRFFNGIKFNDLLINRSLSDNIFFNGLIEKKYKYKKRGKNEVKILKKAKYVLGRTSWDYAHTKKYNQSSDYYYCHRNLRKEFYDTEWDINYIERNSLFMSQAGYPIKGLHILLEAIYYLKQEIPNIKLYIGGSNRLACKSLISKLSKNGYEKYIEKLIKKYELSDNIVFTGNLNSEKMIEKLKNSHIYVLPSMMENSPNSLGEAQIIGVPSVSSLVGGTSDYIKDNFSGMLYDSCDPAMLAYKISLILKDDSLAMKLSRNGRLDAIKRHNKEKNTDLLIQSYKDIINKHNLIYK